MRSSVLLLLLSACSSSTRPAPIDNDNGRPVAISEARAQGAEMAFLLSGSATGQLGTDLRANRRWLRLEAPRAFSFAGADLLAGATDWSVSSATATFARERGGKADGTTLVRVAGKAPADSVVEIANPNMRSEGLGLLENVSVRVLLGRGIDSLLRRGNSEAVIWIAVVDAEGKKVDWTESLSRAYKAQTTHDLRDLYVLLERNTLADRTYHRAPLATILIAAQSKLTRDGEGKAMSFIWEGVWRGYTAREEPMMEATAWETQPQLVYKEYVAPRRRSGLLRTVFAPVALAGDFGAAFLDPEADEGLFRETRDRQRARR